MSAVQYAELSSKGARRVAKQANYISHWHQLIENFQTSSMDFYRSLYKAVKERSVPEIQVAQVEHKEGGLASAYRVYMRVHRGKHAFDICAAPFGTGFFVSWWFTEPPLKFAVLYTLCFLFCLVITFNIAYFIGFALGMAILAAAGQALMAAVGGIICGFGFAFFGVPTILWFLGNAMRRGHIGGETTILAMPLIGRIYERVFS